MAHDSSVHVVSLLIERILSIGSEQVIKGSEGTLGPDDESTQLTTRSQLQQVHSVNIAHINTRDISEGL